VASAHRNGLPVHEGHVFKGDAHVPGGLLGLQFTCSFILNYQLFFSAVCCFAVLYE